MSLCNAMSTQSVTAATLLGHRVINTRDTVGIYSVILSTIIQSSTYSLIPNTRGGKRSTLQGFVGTQILACGFDKSQTFSQIQGTII